MSDVEFTYAEYKRFCEFVFFIFYYLHLFKNRLIVLVPFLMLHSRVTMAGIISFNFRRSGEVAKLTKTRYAKREKDTGESSPFSERITFNDIERAIAKQVQCVIVRGM